MPPRAKKTTTRKTTKKTTKPETRFQRKLTIEQKKSICAYKAPVRLSSGDAVPFYILQPNTSRKIRRCIKSVGTRDQVVKGQRSFTGRGGKMYSTDHKNSNGIILNNAWEQIGLSKNDIFEHEGKLKSKRQSKKTWAQVSGEETTPTKKVAKKTAAAKKTPTVAAKTKECQEQGKVYNKTTKRCREPKPRGRQSANVNYERERENRWLLGWESRTVAAKTRLCQEHGKVYNKTTKRCREPKPRGRPAKTSPVKKVAKKTGGKPRMVKRKVRFQQIGSNGTVFNI